MPGYPINSRVDALLKEEFDIYRKKQEPHPIFKKYNLNFVPFKIDIDKLIIKEAYCGKQVVMKRFRARAKGRASAIMKPYSNVTIILTEKVKEKESHGTKS